MANQPHSLEGQLTTKHLAYLVNTLHAVASKCHDFGLQLGVDEDTICKVERDRERCDDQLREILHKGLKLGCLTMNSIVQALETETVGEKLLASEIVCRFSSQLQGAASQQVVGTNTAAPPPPSHHSAPQPTLHPNTTVPCAQPYPPPIVDQPPFDVSGEQQALQRQPPLQHIPSHQPQAVAQSHGTGSQGLLSQQMPQPVATSLPIPPQVAHLLLHELQPTPPLHQVTGQPVVTPTSVAYEQSTAQYVQADIHPHILWQPGAGGGTPTPQWPPDPPQPLSYDPTSMYNIGLAVSRPYPPPVLLHHFIQHVNQPSHNPQLSMGQGMATPYPPQAGQQTIQGQLQLQHVSSHESHRASPAISPQAKRARYESSSLVQYIEYIKSVYEESVLTEHNVVKWPPTPSKVYINLVCVDHTTHVPKEELDECTRAMICHGSVDVVLGQKTPIDFSDIAREIPKSKRRVILVEGAPGVGKSTLAGEFCRRWERGEVAQQYKLVLLLRLRDKGMSEAQSLADLLYHPSKDVAQAVEDELIATLGANTLIILEGFDELPRTCRTESGVFLRLINGTYLPQATVMVTSRPWATQYLHWKCSNRILQHIEILGFTRKQIEEYVTSVFMDEQNVANDKARENIDEVMSYIKTYPQIQSCMYIPLNSAIVVSVYQESKAGKCILPQTLTELYLALTQTLLLRYLYGHPEYSKRRWKIQSLKNDLPPDVYTKLLAISELAYSGICTDQMGSVQLIFTNLPPDFETLGLMQSVPQLYVTQGEDMSHNFLHLTVQEFFAALHISNMSPEKQLEHFQMGRGREDGRWRVVLRFLAGITKLDRFSPDILRELLLRNPNEDLTKPAKLSPSPLSLSQEKPDADQITEWEASMFVRRQDPVLETIPKTWDRLNMSANVELTIQHVHWMFEAQRNDIVSLVLQERTVEFMGDWGLVPLDYYSLGYCIVHSSFHWVLTFACFTGNQDVIGEEEVRMLVAGANTRPDTSARVVGLRGYHTGKGLHGYSPLSISAEALNVLFVEMKNVLHLQELCLTLPVECSSIPWPGLSEIRVLHLGMKGGRNWKLDTLLRHLSLELLEVTVSSGEDGLGFDNVASIGKLFLSSKLNCPKRVHITVVPEVHQKQFDNTTLLLKEEEPVHCLDWYSVGCIIAHSNFQWMLTVEKERRRKEVIGEEEVRMLVEGANTRQATSATDTNARVVGLRGYCMGMYLPISEGKIGMKMFLERSGYCPLSMSIGTLNVVFVKMKNVLHLQELHLSLPIQCSNIQWPNLSKLRVLDIEISDERNWRLDSFSEPARLRDTVALEAIRRFLSSSDCLKYLHFKIMFHLNAEFMESFTKALSENESLQLWYLGVDCNCTFSDTAAHHLALFITNSATLNHLSIVGCTFSAHGLLELAQAIHDSSSLQERMLRGLTCTVDGDDDATQLSVDYPQVMDCLDELTASHITDRGAADIATALCHNSILKVSNDSNSDAGSAAVAQGLHHNSTLRRLNLSNNSIGDTGLKKLAQALHQISTLTQLNLSSNSIGDDGSVALAQALHHNFTLEWLDLSGNDAIGEGGTHQLVQALMVNTSAYTTSPRRIGFGVFKTLVLPWRCEEYATQRPQFGHVWRIVFH